MSQKSQAIRTKSKGELSSREMQRSLTNVTKLKPDPHPLVEQSWRRSASEALEQTHISSTDSKASQNQRICKRQRNDDK